jgi:hypothetical protein
MDCLTRSIAGNSVLIKHADGEFCLLAHLKRGSVKVKAGEAVKQARKSVVAAIAVIQPNRICIFNFKTEGAFISAAACP